MHRPTSSQFIALMPLLLLLGCSAVGEQQMLN
jgi:hypothetical protein